MKSTFLKTISFSLATLFVVAPLAIASNVNNAPTQTTLNTHNINVSPSRLTTDEIVKLSTYDGRTEGYTTAVKDQRTGSIQCWPHAVAAALESSLLKQNVVSGLTSSTLDLNEKNIDWATNVRTAATDPLGLSSQDTISNPIGQYGYTWYATNALMQWNSPVSETSAYDTLSNPLAIVKDAFYMNTYSTYGLDNPSTLINKVKTAVAEYGAVAFSYTIYGNSYMGKYYHGDVTQTDVDAHACAIVGWDDTIPKTSYSPASEIDGGWIVKNSWGTSSNDSGYFYMSYDSDMRELFGYGLTAKDTYQNNYYYDGLTNSPYTTSPQIYSGEEVGVIFPTLKASSTLTEKLAAVNLGILGDDVTATVKVYTGVNANLNDRTDATNDPSSGTLAATVSKTFTSSGYYTIDLPTPVTLKEGENFGIVVEVTNTDGDAAVMLSSETSTNDMTYHNVNGKWTSTATNDLGGDEQGNLVPRLKAFTNTSTTTDNGGSGSGDNNDNNNSSGSTTTKSSSLSTPAIIGISVGGAGAALLIGSSVYFSKKKKK